MASRPMSFAALGLATLAAVALAACGPKPATQGPNAADEGAAAAEGPATTREYTMAYGAQTIHVYVDPSMGLEHEVARLFALFEELRAESVPLDQRMRLPIGWTTLSFAVEGEHGQRLIVEEPDYANQPEFRTRSDVSVSLAVLARQREVLGRTGVGGEAISFEQHVLTIRGALELDEVLLLRVASPGGRLSGWRLAPASGLGDDDEVESLPVYAILEARPALLDAMLLPPGYMAYFSGDLLTVIVDERDEVVWDYSVAGLDHERERPKPLLEPLSN
jgi:hypothetical protein